MSPRLSGSGSILVLKGLGRVCLSSVLLGSGELKSKSSLSKGSSGSSGLVLITINNLNSGKDCVSSSELLGLNLLQVIHHWHVSIGYFQKNRAYVIR
jgi:hypothetical protein